MVEIINAIIGMGVIVLNIIPFVIKKPKYILLTAILSFIMISLLFFFKSL